MNPEPAYFLWMSRPSPGEIIAEQAPVVEQMTRDECWYMGERECRPVSEREPQLIARVSQLLFEHGASMRSEAIKRIQVRERNRAS